MKKLLLTFSFVIILTTGFSQILIGKKLPLVIKILGKTEYTLKTEKNMSVISFAYDEETLILGFFNAKTKECVGSAVVLLNENSKNYWISHYNKKLTAIEEGRWEGYVDDIKVVGNYNTTTLDKPSIFFMKKEDYDKM